MKIQRSLPLLMRQILNLWVEASTKVITNLGSRFYAGTLLQSGFAFFWSVSTEKKHSGPIITPRSSGIQIVFMVGHSMSWVASNVVFIATLYGPRGVKAWSISTNSIKRRLAMLLGTL